jgi:proline iminopeptidase
MHGSIANSQVAVFPNSSHTPFYEEPQAYFARLEKFLRDHDRR